MQLIGYEMKQGFVFVMLAGVVLFLGTLLQDVLKNDSVTTTSIGVVETGQGTPNGSPGFLEGSPTTSAGSINGNAPPQNGSPVPVSTPVPAFTIHEVVSGDSLYAISLAYGVTIDELKLFNGLTSDALDVGDQIKIPPSSSDAP